MGGKEGVGGMRQRILYLAWLRDLMATRLRRDSPGDIQALIQARACSSSLTWNALISAFVKNRARCIDA